MSRQAVLQALRSREGGYLSGEELSRQLGLSRTAIWKAVDALRKDGYQIEARTGLGYRLSAVPDALTVEEIRNALAPPRRWGGSCTVLMRWIPPTHGPNNWPWKERKTARLW